MTGFVRGVGIAALALAAACSRGGSGGNAGSSGSAGGEGTRSADGVVASVSESAVKVKTQDGRVLDFPMKDDVKVTLAGGEATSAVVTEGAPVRVSFKEGGKGNELVAIDVEPKGGAGAAASPAPAQEPPPYGANQGSSGAAAAPPPAGAAAGQAEDRNRTTR